MELSGRVDKFEARDEIVHADVLFVKLNQDWR